jgi:hypothetical protein
MTEGVDNSETRSADGLWSWNGTEWVPTRISWIAPVEAPLHLDKRASGKGRLPPKGPLPEEPIYEAPGVAVGKGWLATGYGTRWRVLPLAQVSAVVVVRQSLVIQVMESRDWKSGAPQIVFVTASGSVLRIRVDRFIGPIRSLVANQLTRSVELTHTSQAFLSSGRLPGRWGRPYQVGGFRFGKERL